MQITRELFTVYSDRGPTTSIALWIVDYTRIVNEMA